MARIKEHESISNQEISINIPFSYNEIFIEISLYENGTI